MLLHCCRSQSRISTCAPPSRPNLALTSQLLCLDDLGSFFPFFPFVPAYGVSATTFSVLTFPDAAECVVNESGESVGSELVGWGGAERSYWRLVKEGNIAGGRAGEEGRHAIVRRTAKVASWGEGRRRAGMRERWRGSWEVILWGEAYSRCEEKQQPAPSKEEGVRPRSSLLKPATAPNAQSRAPCSLQGFCEVNYTAMTCVPVFEGPACAKATKATPPARRSEWLG